MIDVAPARRHDTARDGTRQAERIADGQHAIAHTCLVAVAERYDWEGRLAFDLDHPEIGTAVASYDLGWEHRAILQRDRYLVSILDDVVVGHDIAVRRDDESRARACILRGGSDGFGAWFM